MGESDELDKFINDSGLTEKKQNEWTQWYCDKAVVTLFRAKNKLGAILNSFGPNSTDVPDAQKIITELNEKGNAVRISTEMLKRVLKLITKTESDSVLFRVSKDYPMFVGAEDFEVIIAPRVEE
jgi:hypothetical protein